MPKWTVPWLIKISIYESVETNSFIQPLISQMDHDAILHLRQTDLPDVFKMTPNPVKITTTNHQIHNGFPKYRYKLYSIIQSFSNFRLHLCLCLIMWSKIHNCHNYHILWYLFTSGIKKTSHCHVEYIWSLTSGCYKFATIIIVALKMDKRDNINNKSIHFFPCR